MLKIASESFICALLLFLGLFLKTSRWVPPTYRFGKLAEVGYTIKVNDPEAKRIVFGTTGNYQLLLDLKHDDRPAVN